MADDFVVQVVSDLHLETDASYNTYQLPKAINTQHIALLGDIGQVSHPGLWVFVERLLRQYSVVFFLLGNHEPWGCLYEDARDRVTKFIGRLDKLRLEGPAQCSGLGQFVWLDQVRYDVPETNITVLGCTLFSHITKEQQLPIAQQVHDFNRIIDWMIADHNEAHWSDLKWLNDTVARIVSEDPDRQIAIFTHYCPTIDPSASNPRHRGSHVSSAFVTDLSRELCWTNPNVKVWAFGHTHYNCDYTDSSSGKRVLANQKGYAMFPRHDFDPEKSIRLRSTTSKST